MPTWVALDDDPATGDDIPTAFLELEGRTLEVRQCFIGGSPPASPVEGQLWLDNSAIPYRLYIYAKITAGSPAWQPLGPLSRLPESINADPSPVDDRAAPFQFKALRVENRASLPTAAAGNAGMLVMLTGTGELWMSDQPVSGDWKGLLSVATGSKDTVELGVEGDLGNDATNPPTKQRKGALEGWLFDATNEKRTFAFPVPKNWNGASDLKLRLLQVLNGAQTAGDDIEWSGEVRVLPLAGGKTGQAVTTLVDATTDIGSDAEGIDDGGGPHVTELVVDYDDATNPVSVGALVLVTVWRKTVGGAGKVSGVVVFRAELAYAQKPRHERA
jgi:hypothetical protein